MIEETALLVCAKTQISMDRNDPTMAIAPRLSFALTSIFPIIAVSVNDKIGSATPAIKAGIASLLMFLRFISVFKAIVRNNERDIHFASENKYQTVSYSHEVHRTSDF